MKSSISCIRRRNSQRHIPKPGTCGSFHKQGGPDYRPPNTIVLFLGTPQLVPAPNFGNPMYTKVSPCPSKLDACRRSACFQSTCEWHCQLKEVEDQPSKAACSCRQYCKLCRLRLPKYLMAPTMVFLSIYIHSILRPTLSEIRSSRQKLGKSLVPQTFIETVSTDVVPAISVAEAVFGFKQGVLAIARSL